MEKYKVCPLCGTHNDPIMLECINCENDLSSVLIMDEETEKMHQDSEIGSSNQSARMVRLCDCGIKNPIQARKCIGCGEDISDIVPSEDGVEEKNRIILSSLDGAYAYEIDKSEIIIGREHYMMEYLEKKPFVSRKHAELHLEGEKLFIKNLSSTNFTYCNNEKISSTEFMEVMDGDEIGLGGIEKDGSRQSQAAYFIVRIGACI